jgi:hypothetical protein
MVREDVRRLSVVEAILTIGDGVPWYWLHVVHLAQTCQGILDEVELWCKLFDKVKAMLVHFVALLCVVALWFQTTRDGVLCPMMGYCRNAECRAIETSPYHVGLSESLQYHVGS